MEQDRLKEFLQKNKKDNWVTPPELIDPINEYVGIDLDPCAGKYPNGDITKHGETNYALPEDDGLEKEWFGTVFINPPFSEKRKWIMEATKRYATDDDVDQIIVLTPDSTDTISWWHEYIKAYFRYSWFKEGRLNYIDPTTREKVTGVSFGSALSILGEIPPDFLYWLKENGDIVQRFHVVYGGD